MATRAALLAWLTLAVMAVSAHADAVDWLDTQKVRAAYHYGRPPVVARIERLQQVGINCMILKCDTDKALKWLPEAKTRGMHTFLALNFNVKATDRGFRRAVLDRGETEAYACPLDARFWQDHLTPAVMDRVNLSVGPRYGASGLWIDFELYSTTTGQRYYTRACYCEHCFGRFCQNAGVTTPGLEPKERWKWLKEQGYDDRYQPFLQTRIERLATALRERVHAVNPAFLLGFYPTPKNWSLVGVARGFATKRVPILLWATDTYGGGGADRVPENWREHYAALGINARYVAGLLLRCYSAGNLAANLYHTSRACDGYWLFTTYTLNNPVAKHRGDYYLAAGTPDEYWQAIQHGNAEIEKGLAAGPGYESSLHVGPEPVVLHMLRRPETWNRLLRLASPEPTGVRAKMPTVLLRGTNVLVVAGQADRPAELALGFKQVGAGKEGIAWQAVDMVGRSLGSGKGSRGASVQIRLTPNKEGILEDSTITLPSPLPPVLSLVPEHAFGVRPE